MQLWRLVLFSSYVVNRDLKKNVVHQVLWTRKMIVFLGTGILINTSSDAWLDAQFFLLGFMA